MHPIDSEYVAECLNNCTEPSDDGSDSEVGDIPTLQSPRPLTPEDENDVNQYCISIVLISLTLLLPQFPLAHMAYMTTSAPLPVTAPPFVLSPRVLRDNMPPASLSFNAPSAGGTGLIRERSNSVEVGC